MIYLVGGTICMSLLEATTQPWAEAAIKLVNVETVAEAESKSVKSVESTSNEEVAHF